MPTPGLGGVAATDRVVIVSGRDLNDTVDLWRCLDAETGETRWSVRQPAAGNLDFGPSPRTTPLIHDGMVYCLGAFGHLLAIDIASGKVVWKRDSVADFGSPVTELPWGLCGSPLIAGNKLIYYPGGSEAALVALNPKDGEVIWKTAGSKPSYGSFIVATLGGVDQLIGHDATTLGGWDLSTGKRLWTITPERSKDFNVPTPIVHDGRLIIATENNGTRMFSFESGGKINPKPIAKIENLNPDTHSPVRIGNRLFGAHNGLQCFDLAKNLRSLWSGEDDVLSHHMTIVGSDTRLLIINLHAEAILVDATADKLTVLSRRKFVDDEVGLYSHPAFANGKMFLRASDAVLCFDLTPQSK